MIDSLIKRYIWLIQTIRDAGENGIPFSEYKINGIKHRLMTIIPL